ncbi:fumarylacetoacetate hydrolase family protein [Saccharopolyspora shandongensis]|uniref:fumarylacetoacetate hydrolase family protein n=1 Tax=Saccharopolyspora shandongensis TaxID=418495 RepID=UPI00344AAA9C
MCTGNWSSLHWLFGDMIAYVSRGSRVQACDLIGSGTVGGRCLLEHLGNDPQSTLRLSPGDHVTLETERLGSISATIAPAKEVIAIPGSSRVSGWQTWSWSDTPSTMPGRIDAGRAIDP